FSLDRVNDRRHAFSFNETCSLRSGCCSYLPESHTQYNEQYSRKSRYNFQLYEATFMYTLFVLLTYTSMGYARLSGKIASKQIAISSTIHLSTVPIYY